MLHLCVSSTDWTRIRRHWRGTVQTVGLLCASGGTFRVIRAHLHPSSRWIILYTAVREPPAVTLRANGWGRMPGCLFAQGSNMTTEEEIGNITDYLTDSFHQLDLKLEVSQSAIRGR